MSTEDGIDYSEAPNLTGRSIPAIVRDSVHADVAAENQAAMAAGQVIDPRALEFVAAEGLQPGETPMEVVPMPEGGGGGGMGVGMSGSVPMPGGENPYLQKAEQALRSGAELERQGVTAQAEVEASKAKGKAEAMTKAEAAAAEHALNQKKLAERMDQMDREFEQKNIADEEEVRRAYAQRVDPSRYWANKDAGQKAMSVIAAGIFGYLGKGMEYLKRLDNLVAEDIALQERERASKISMAEKLQAKHGADYKTLRNMREQAYENSIRAENKVWQGLKLTLEQIDVSHAGQAAMAQKDVSLAHINQNLAKNYISLAQIHDKNKTAEASLALREMALQQRGQSVRRLPPQAETGLQHRLSYIQALERMRAEVSQAEGLGKVGTTLTSFFGEKGEQRDRFQQAFHDAVRERSQSALQQHEIKYFGGDLPGFNDWMKSSPRQLDTMIRNAYQGIQEYANFYQKRGFDVDPNAYAPADTTSEIKARKVE